MTLGKPTGTGVGWTRTPLTAPGRRKRSCVESTSTLIESLSTAGTSIGAAAANSTHVKALVAAAPASAAVPARKSRRARVRVMSVSVERSAVRQTLAHSQRNGQQGVDLAAVEDDGLFHEMRARVARERDAILITAGREQRRLAGVHDARDQKVRYRAHDAVLVRLDQGRAHGVAIALALVDIG